MLDDFPSLHGKSGRADLLLILAIGAALTGWSFHSAWAAWLGTPDVANFRQFAEPWSSKHGTKGVYLFSGVACQVAALLALLSGCLSERIRGRMLAGRASGRAQFWLFFPLYFLICLWGTHHASSRALHAAASASASSAPVAEPTKATRPAPE